jgi:stage IV sporulation protein FB
MHEARLTARLSRQDPEFGQNGVVFSFRVFGIPVTVQASFLLVAALLGLSGGRLSLVLTWVGVVFVSILVHEMGHALTARAFGATVAIELNGIGGLTSWSGTEDDVGPGRRAAIAAAGSAVGVIFGALIWMFEHLTGPYTGALGFTISTLVWVNVFWGLLNWLPIRPLDGGHLLVSLLQKVAPSRVVVISNVIFFITSAAALAVSLWLRLYFVSFLAGWLLLGELTRGRPRRPAVPIPPMTFDPPEPAGETEKTDG